jgi:EAL domain-containing protein (putative c-di-GMP-specific phosphodiesterase class I)
VQALKVDRSFISALTHPDPNVCAHNDAIVRTILALAQALQLEVTAEGVEERAQERRLIALGARYAQGYLFSMPLPAEAITSYLSASSSAHLRLAA